MRIIAISNLKGGSGKTTTAINISACLAENNRKVLLVDLDSQASTSNWLGFERTTGENSLIYNSHSGIVQELSKETSIPNLSLVPYITVKNSKMEIKPGNGSILKNIFKELPNNLWDYVIFDCSPSLNIMTLNALVASNEVIVPVVAHSLTLHGIVNLLEVIKSVKAKLNTGLYISGILPCRVNKNVRHTMEILALLKERFGDLVYKTYIREDIKIAESPSYGQSIFQFDMYSAGADDFREVTKQIIEQEDKK
ncbi:MAG: ParA family protein [Leptospiraceae bacterium]|nr:ParA family protein [Leptospiraceae bacterium]